MWHGMQNEALAQAADLANHAWPTQLYRFGACGGPINVITKDTACAIAILEDGNDRLVYTFLTPHLFPCFDRALVIS